MSRLARQRAIKFKKRKNILIALGLIFIGLVCVGYPSWLWVEARLEQHRLDQAFNPVIEGPVDQGAYVEDTGDKGKAEVPQWTDFPPTRIILPSLEVDVNVVAVNDLNIFSDRLNHPPGYYPTSRYPGEKGNVTIAGHRGGPAGYFLDVDKLEPGDMVILDTPEVSFNYEVERVFITDSTDFSVVGQTDYAALTLTTCQRVGSNSSAKRLIVRAKLKDVVFKD